MNQGEITCRTRLHSFGHTATFDHS